MIKKPSDNHPDVIALHEANQKIHALEIQQQDTQQQLEAMHRDYSRMASLTHATRIDLQASALLQGRELSVVTRDDLERQRGRIEVLNAAIEEQSRLASIAAGKVSKRVQEANAGEYLGIQKRMRKAVEELASVNADEVNFFRELRAAGCSNITLRPMAVAAIGTLADKQSGASFFMVELKQFVPEAAE